MATTNNLKDSDYHVKITAIKATRNTASGNMMLIFEGMADTPEGKEKISDCWTQVKGKGADINKTQIGNKLRNLRDIGIVFKKENPFENPHALDDMLGKVFIGRLETTKYKDKTYKNWKWIDVAKKQESLFDEEKKQTTNELPQYNSFKNQQQFIDWLNDYMIGVCV